VQGVFLCAAPRVLEDGFAEADMVHLAVRRGIFGVEEEQLLMLLCGESCVLAGDVLYETMAATHVVLLQAEQVAVREEHGQLRHDARAKINSTRPGVTIRTLVN
jgi:hypothetical protein